MVECQLIDNLYYKGMLKKLHAKQTVFAGSKKKYQLCNKIKIESK